MNRAAVLAQDVNQATLTQTRTPRQSELLSNEPAASCAAHLQAVGDECQDAVKLVVRACRVGEKERAEASRHHGHLIRQMGVADAEDIDRAQVRPAERSHAEDLVPAAPVRAVDPRTRTSDASEHGSRR